MVEANMALHSTASENSFEFHFISLFNFFLIRNHLNAFKLSTGCSLLLLFLRQRFRISTISSFILNRSLTK